LKPASFAKGLRSATAGGNASEKRWKRFHKLKPGITPASRRLERLADVTHGMVRALPNAPSLDVLQTAPGFYR